MRPFTDEEFDIMIAQIIDEEHPSFDMLYSIADKTLRPTVDIGALSRPLFPVRIWKTTLCRMFFAA